MKKVYVLDTNVMLSDPMAHLSFEDNDVIIPMIVIEELDKQKNRQDDVGKNARSVCRSLDSLKKDGSNLYTGVLTPLGGTLRVVSTTQGVASLIPSELTLTKADNIIIGLMVNLRTQGLNPILVSRDINMRIKCDSLEIQCQDYRRIRVADDKEKFYTGVKVVEINDELYAKLFEEKCVSGDQLQCDAKLITNDTLFPNQIVLVKHKDNLGSSKTAFITRVLENDDPTSFTLSSIQEFKSVYGLKPKSKEQKFALDLLMDPEVKLLTLIGPSGVGKTCLTLAAALEQLKTVGGTSASYNKVIVTRPVQPLGKDIGFLPGTLEEKMSPWIAPIKDNFSHLVLENRVGGSSRRTVNESSSMLLQQYIDKGLIEIEALTYIRGRSIPDAFIVIDECQNLTQHEVKTIITRASEGTKIVLLGDIEQIDNMHVDAFTNGLTYVIEKFKEHQIAGHVTMLKGVRSKLATLASQIL